LLVQFSAPEDAGKGRDCAGWAVHPELSFMVIQQLGIVVRCGEQGLEQPFKAAGS
jgi:hypothetical protein